MNLSYEVSNLFSLLKLFLGTSVVLCLLTGFIIFHINRAGTVSSRKIAEFFKRAVDTIRVYDLFRLVTHTTERLLSLLNHIKPLNTFIQYAKHDKLYFYIGALVFGVALYHFLQDAIVIIFFVSSTILMPFMVFYDEKDPQTVASRWSPYGKPAGIFMIIFYGLGLLYHATRIDLVIALLFMIIFSITTGQFAWLSIGKLCAKITNANNRNRQGLVGAFFAVNLSFIFSFLAFIIGNQLDPYSPIPRTMQVLLVNALFDGLAMFLILYLLRWAIRKNALARLPVAIIMDLAWAAVFAVLSLYLGLIWSEHQISFEAACRVLVGLAPDGGGWQFGPYFWVMHTTFIPTAIYVSFIALVWFIKLTLAPVEWFLALIHAKGTPLQTSAVLSGLLAAVFGLFYFLCDAALT